MARLWTSGFEMNSATSGVEWSTVSGSPTIASATKRSGSYSGRITSLASGTAKFFRWIPASGPTVGFVRAYFRYHTLPTAANTILSISSGGTMLVAVKLNTDATLTLLDEDGTIGTGATVISADTFTRLEIKVDESGGAGAHIVELKIEGAVEVTSSTRSISSACNQFNFGGNLATEAQTVGDWYFDDVAINDNTGANQNDYPGEGSIIHLHPDSDVQAAGFALVGAAAEWDCVNDPDTPDDATTRVVFSQSTQQGIYSLTNTPAEVTTPSVINLVHAGWRAAGNAASTGNDMYLHLRQNGSDTSIGPKNTAVATYRTNNFGSSTDTSYPITRYTNANTGKAFTKDDIDNNLTIGLQRGATQSNNPSVTDIWVVVEFIPTTVKNFTALGVG